MELAQNQILIELSDGINKADVFNTIAVANGWREYNEKPIIDGVKVAGRQEAEAKAQEFIALGTFDGADEVEKDVFFVKYRTTIKEKNPIDSETFGRNLLINKVKEEYAKAQLEIDTQEEKEALAQKQKTIIETMNNISINVQ